MFQFTPETAAETDEVEWLYDLAFAPGRNALSSYKLREGIPPVAELCLTARDDLNILAGAIRYWPIRIGMSGAAALLLGPIAIHPTRQGEGLGAMLMVETLACALALGWDRVVLVGDEPYYRRFGFTRKAAEMLNFPPPTNPDRVLARALKPGAFEGVSGDIQRWVD